VVKIIAKGKENIVPSAKDLKKTLPSDASLILEERGGTVKGQVRTGFQDHNLVCRSGKVVPKESLADIRAREN
jgi:hypothetical protein